MVKQNSLHVLLSSSVMTKLDSILSLTSWCSCYRELYRCPHETGARSLKIRAKVKADVSKAMANYLIMLYAKNNQDPTLGSPMLGLNSFVVPCDVVTPVHSNSHLEQWRPGLLLCGWENCQSTRELRYNHFQQLRFVIITISITIFCSYCTD
ncbi:hypothetical protein PoB_003150300 [Plakobranchus ocellatus]|uniref:Uncharacterized protein n=1 Tax=Plakobranchus ocellatus TaxID=259542 RepID=A0AAV4ADW8_9GAST|nr:hypothetical protein PoB_003150300 [Plakobranchus ocellatus]